MKKLTLILAILLSAGLAKAQTYDSIAHLNLGWYDIDLRNMMQLRDGSILANCQMFEVDEQGQYVDDYGNKFIKISRQGAMLLDSVFIEDNDLNFFLLKRNPLDNDNVFAKVERDLENVRCDLHITFFDDDLNFIPKKEVWVPISDTLFTALGDSYFLDEQGNIVFSFSIPSRNELHFYKVGLNGTIKSHTVLSQDASPINYHSTNGHYLGIFNESPKEYCYWGTNHSDFSTIYIHVFDSLLNLNETLTLGQAPANIYFDYGMNDYFLDLNDGTFLLTSRFHQTTSNKSGVHITRYNKNTLEAINTCYFMTYPEVTISGFTCGCAFPIGLAKAGDGDIYFAYCTQDPTAGNIGQVAVVKMDTDFNIIWQRFCLEPVGYSRIGRELIALENGGVAVGGVIFGIPPELFFLIFDDGNWNVSETEVSIRPYTYYPNPAQDELHLHYSPDVTPTKIELYDLQGRLVKTQHNGLGSINLEGLASGTYTMRVMLEGGKVFSDKVVKD